MSITHSMGGESERSGFIVNEKYVGFKTITPLKMLFQRVCLKIDSYVPVDE